MKYSRDRMWPLIIMFGVTKPTLIIFQKIYIAVSLCSYFAEWSLWKNNSFLTTKLYDAWKWNHLNYLNDLYVLHHTVELWSAKWLKIHVLSDIKMPFRLVNFLHKLVNGNWQKDFQETSNVKNWSLQMSFTNCCVIEGH